MLRYILILAIWLGLSIDSLCQTISVSGYITDSKSGERLAGATIKDSQDKLKRAVITKVIGNPITFVLNLKI